MATFNDDSDQDIPITVNTQEPNKPYIRTEQKLTVSYALDHLAARNGSRVSSLVVDAVRQAHENLLAEVKLAQARHTAQVKANPQASIAKPAVLIRFEAEKEAQDIAQGFALAKAAGFKLPAKKPSMKDLGVIRRGTTPAQASLQAKAVEPSKELRKGGLVAPKPMLECMVFFGSTKGKSWPLPYKARTEGDSPRKLALDIISSGQATHVRVTKWEIKTLQVTDENFSKILSEKHKLVKKEVLLSRADLESDRAEYLDDNKVLEGTLGESYSHDSAGYIMVARRDKDGNIVGYVRGSFDVDTRNRFTRLIDAKVHSRPAMKGAAFIRKPSFGPVQGYMKVRGLV